MDLPDFEEPRDPDSFSKKLWAQVPEPVRKNVEQHVSANLPDDLLAKLRELHARGLPISDDDAFFHFGGGMAVRNLCRERLSDEALAALVFFGVWDDCYIGSSRLLPRCGSNTHCEIDNAGLTCDRPAARFAMFGQILCAS
ncbi:hypothetical protein [Bradyrhizobium sp. NAS80.1]|uniref:hypothetical protein n=1 Tax=Bradyrhizobium sp. NAS80.1 TaxID=1680159 RepID=UPI0011611083|nr:hypothetical protein [Bradyrhizobium sp. NAS80.1]